MPPVDIPTSDILPLVRAQNGAEIVAGELFTPVLSNSWNYSPICGYDFWDNDYGAEAACLDLGFDAGEVFRTNAIYGIDATSFGSCKAGETLDRFFPAFSINLCAKLISTSSFAFYHHTSYTSCLASPASNYWCLAGFPIGVDITCFKSGIRIWEAREGVGEMPDLRAKGEKRK